MAKVKKLPKTKAVALATVCAECERCVSCGKKAAEHNVHAPAITWTAPYYQNITSSGIKNNNTLYAVSKTDTNCMAAQKAASANS